MFGSWESSMNVTNSPTKPRLASWGEKCSICTTKRSPSQVAWPSVFQSANRGSSVPTGIFMLVGMFSVFLMRNVAGSASVVPDGSISMP